MQLELHADRAPVVTGPKPRLPGEEAGVAAGVDHHPRRQLVATTEWIADRDTLHRVRACRPRGLSAQRRLDVGPQPKLRAGLDGLLGEPLIGAAHVEDAADGASVGLDRLGGRSDDPNPMDRVVAPLRHSHRLERLDEAAATGANWLADGVPALEDDDLHSAARGLGGSRKPGRAAADNRDVDLRIAPRMHCHPSHHGRRARLRAVAGRRQPPARLGP